MRYAHERPFSIHIYISRPSVLEDSEVAEFAKESQCVLEVEAEPWAVGMFHTEYTFTAKPLAVAFRAKLIKYLAGMKCDPAAHAGYKIDLKMRDNAGFDDEQSAETCRGEMGNGQTPSIRKWGESL